VVVDVNVNVPALLGVDLRRMRCRGAAASEGADGGTKLHAMEAIPHFALLHIIGCSPHPSPSPGYVEQAKILNNQSCGGYERWLRRLRSRRTRESTVTVTVTAQHVGQRAVCGGEKGRG
jgi:hypothetical protein